MKNTHIIFTNLITTLAADIKAGVTKSTIKARLLNNGASEELATKITRLAEIGYTL